MQHSQVLQTTREEVDEKIDRTLSMSQPSSGPNANPPLRLPLSAEDRHRLEGLVATLGGGSPEWTVRRILRIQSAVLAAHEIETSLPKFYEPEELKAAHGTKRDGKLYEIQLGKSWKAVLKEQQRALDLDVWSKTFRRALRTTCALLEHQAAGKSISIKPHTHLLLQKGQTARM